MSSLIRIAAGAVTASALTSTSSYLVTNFPAQTDMTPSDEWLLFQVSRADSDYVQALGFGGNYVGGVRTVLQSHHMTHDQYQYIRSNLLNRQVTVYVQHAADDWQAYQGRLTETGEKEEAARGYANVQFLFSNGKQV